MPGRRVECVILAAGSSIRLGKEKALIPVNSRTLVGWLAERVSERGLRPVIVTKSEIEGAVSKDVGKCELVINPDPSRGRTGSLQVGISTLDKSAGKGYRLLVVPVDRPGFSSSTLDRLIQSEVTCCPSRNGRGGHPLLLSVEDVDRARKVASDTPLREVVNPQRFEVDDPELHMNIDTPEDIEFLEERLAIVTGRTKI